MKILTKLAIILMIFLTAYSLQLKAVHAEIPHLINYQSKLTDANGTPVTGTKQITFRIYDTASGGTPLWEETQSVTINRGIFNVLLGSSVNLDLPFDEQYYLAIKIESDVEMSPRQKIASTGYSFRSKEVDSIPPGVIVMWSGTIADIPDGWALCDGNNGTPDLRDRFIVGAREDEGFTAKTKITGSLMQSGGSTTIAEANLPAHTHEAGTLIANTSGEHVHALTYWGDGGGSGANYLGTNNSYPPRPSTANISSAGSHTHVMSGSTATTGSGTPYAQPYYALAYIMKL